MNSSLFDLFLIKNTACRAYLQATLPVAYGGLGIRLISDVALAGFLSSVCSTVQSEQNLLTHTLHYTYDTNEYWLSSFQSWSQSYQGPMPELKIYQSSWDKVISEFKFQNLIHSTN